MFLRYTLSLVALAASLPTMAQAQSVNDFTLEPVPTPSATPQAQGPADTQNGVAIRPRAVNTPTPTPAPSIVPTPSSSQAVPARSVAPQAGAPRPAPAPREASASGTAPRAAATAPAPVPSTILPGAQPSQAPNSEGLGAPPAAVDQPSVATNSPLALPSATPGSSDQGGDIPWLPIGGAAALLVLLGAGFAAWKRRREAVVPEIERPVVAAATAAASPAAVRDALQLSVETEKLIRSAAYATLKYRMTLVNRTDAPMSDVTVGIDLVSAHASAPMEEQVATDATMLEQRHQIARIAPRQSISFEGQVQLPLAGAHVIHQGRYPLLVPLMRAKVDGPGESPLVKTYVVGLGIPGAGRVQPIRLDEGPRSYEPIAHRELA